MKSIPSLMLLATAIHSLSAMAQTQQIALEDPRIIRSESEDEYGRVVVTHKDTETGVQIETTYGASGLPEQILEKTVGGSLVDRRIYQNDFLIHETFQPFHRLQIERPSAIRPGYLEIELTVWHAGVMSTSTTQLNTRLALQCGVIPPPTDTTSAMKVLRNIDRLKLSAKDGKDYVDFGSNILASKSCDAPTIVDEKTKEKSLDIEGGYDNGVGQLAKDMQVALTVGISCLRDLGNKKWATEALRLSAFLDKQSKPLRFYCGPPGTETARYKNGGHETVREDQVAQALCDPNLIDSPAIQINTKEMNGFKPRERSAMLFHELLHQIGYKHGDGQADLPYLAQYCCFADQKAAPLGSIDVKQIKSDACGLLKSVDPKKEDVDSNEYLSRFMVVMANGMNEPIALNAAIEAAKRAKAPVHGAGASETKPLINGLYLLAAASAMKHAGMGYGAGGDLISAIYYNAGKRNLGGKDAETAQKNYDDGYVKTYSPDKKQLIDALGIALSSELNGDSVSAKAAVKEIKAMGNRACALLDNHEKSALSEDLLGGTTALFIGGVFREDFLQRFCPPPAP